MGDAYFGQGGGRCKGRLDIPRLMSFNRTMNVIDRIITEGARTLTLEDLDALMVVLPKVRDELEAEASPEEGMLDQFRFLRHVAEDAAAGLRREVSLVALAEVTFALLYLTKNNDLIPDNLPHEGWIDDKAIFTTVLLRNEAALKELAISRGHDWEMLISVI
jgi:uncharacterized membrane protein YkvA (DUF1232 family)